MSEPLHTPGPWTAYVMTGEVTVESRCARILYMATIDGDAEAIADAHLIAAAPDLRAAVSAMLAVEQTVFGSPQHATYGERYHAATTAMRAALAKSQGGAA